MSLRDILETMLHIADENAATWRPRGKLRLVTAQTVEDLEWRALHAKLDARRTLLGDDVLAGEDDDGDDIVQVFIVLHAAAGPLTLSEVTSRLQVRGLLSVSFPAAARRQTQALLERLRVANRVWQDRHGRWTLS